MPILGQAPSEILFTDFPPHLYDSTTPQRFQ
jgi:hypothetical protein